jgi:Zn-dependent peptidase ImmA (M78 family)/DNA-binding XRE family transcriptional regulator
MKLPILPVLCAKNDREKIRMARKRTADSPPFTPSVFRWARDHAGYSLDDAAEKLAISREILLDWESDDGAFAPTVKQARDLAALYGRSFLEWFLPAPPNLPEPKLIPDFRLYRGTDDPSETRELLDAQLWAETQRENALDLYSEIGEDVPQVPQNVFATVGSDVDTVAAAVREAMKQQAGLITTQQRAGIPNLIRDKIESLGILTLRRSDLKHYQVKGFCIAEFPLPVIVFTSESPNAQAFTLGHELAHVLLRQSAISGAIPRQGGDPDVRRVEDWCNKFAGAFLIPRSTMLARHPIPNTPQEAIPDSDISKLAMYFGVSEHAMLIRLVELNYVHASYYWDVKKPIYDEEERKFRAFGRPKFYGRRYASSLGTLYTSLVIEAWNAGRITNHNAAEFMGIKNLAHLHEIRENFGT